VLTDGKQRICESTKDAKQAAHKKHKIFEARKKHHWQMENKEFYTCESKYKGPSQSKQLMRNKNLPKQENYRLLQNQEPHKYTRSHVCLSSPNACYHP
jgi:hypothetical protein